jgi:outer membrane lipoprotein-sorting protein
MIRNNIIPKLFFSATCLFSILGFSQQDPKIILDRVDKNMSSENRIIESEMTIHGRRADRTISSITYSVGNHKSFTEYLAPAREQGTKMLKLDNSLWIYSPSTDRTIQISGHMLRQSVMGSDLSYEDLMDNRKLTDIYEAKYEGTEILEGRSCLILDLTAKVEDVAYFSQKLWIDSERFIPLKQELFAKSGQLLKRTTFTDVKQLQGRWFPMTFFYKDVLKDGDGTEFRIKSAKFNQEIPEYIFTKAALKK